MAAARVANIRGVRVIAAAVLSPRGLLTVSKRAAPSVFYLPGGKPEPDEDAPACLRRELREELGVGLAEARPLIEVRAPAALEPIEMEMSVFLARLDGSPAPRAEIAELAWWPERREVELAPAVRHAVIPHLQRLELLESTPPAAW